MTETRIKISSILENQLPQFIREEFPLISEFLSQYYIALENKGGSIDILENIDQYIKIDNLTNLIESTILISDVTFFDSVINVSSTAGFPDSYGLLLINSEIITYTSKTTTTFEGCIRGFSGITSYENKDELIFSQTAVDSHDSETKVINLSILFLKEFFKKLKKQIAPGFEDRNLYPDLNERLFFKQAIDFYSSKGTDDSFKILFRALYGENIEIIKPRDYLIVPSSAEYRITKDLVIEAIDGNPEEFVNSTLYQYQDSSEDIALARGTVSKVEKIRRGLKDYYIISLDSDYDKDVGAVGTIYGDFKQHAKTKVLTETISGSTTLDVDSTVGFPISNSSLIIDLQNGTSLNVSYTSKTLNQFFGCTGITQNIPKETEVKYDYFTYAYSSITKEKIKIRILGVLSDLEVPDNTQWYSEGDIIKIKTLGKDSKDLKANNWFFNIPTKYTINSIQLLDSADKSYNINVLEDHYLKIGDRITITSSSDFEQVGNVIFINNNKSFDIQLGSEAILLNTSQDYVIRKILNKVIFDNYKSIEDYTSNVQNVYLDNNESIYVSSPSLPSYLNRNLKINDRSVTFSGSFNGETLKIGNHGFYTGDSIVYKPTDENSLGISTGIYFIKKVSETEVKLARSRNNIFLENFVSVGGSVFDAKFEFSDFNSSNFNTKLLEPQKLIRKIENPKFEENVYKTEPGLTGIFINGVEILNYKSKDNIYYGSIESIIPTSFGSGYDVINPPVLSILDNSGYGANGYCSVIGKLERIDILDPGFDYIEEPVIEIKGGNGFGALAKANLVTFDHESSVNTTNFAGLVKLSPVDEIKFASQHKFRDAEEVVYLTGNQTAVGGLSTNSTYFVSVKDAFNVKFHNTLNDAIAGINTVQLTSYGEGNHIFRSKNKKRKIGSITIQSQGKNYQNKLVTTGVTGINTVSDTISIKNHGYNSGEIIVYESTEVPVGGLSSSTQYYVTKIDDNQFKLSKIGIETSNEPSSLYYDTKRYINLTTKGTGIHKFNYPEIEVSVKGRTGISTQYNERFTALLQPIFRGEVQSVFVSDGGSNYGSEIINYNAQPTFRLDSGSGIELKPIVSNGQIVEVLVQNSGSFYNSPPNLLISGDGVGAILTPVLSNGTLVEVRVIYGGIGYNEYNTSIIAVQAGSGAKLECKIKSWKINLVERLIRDQKITDDDGILTRGLNSNYGIQYAHAYAPRNLRSSIQATRFINGQVKFIPDLNTLNGKELDSLNSHSPIIGWCYDGNPIYGPNGFSSQTGGSVKTLESGYNLRKDLDILKDLDQRPNYPNGFFIEDYVYDGDGDLDEHNGRFCITPEYPNGTYAYFTTIDSNAIQESGPFNNYKRPVFPYVIGETYKSKPIDFNFKSNSNQDNIDINKTNWKRNISPYNLNLYDYLFNPNKIKQQNSILKSVSKGSVDFVDIEDGGKNYSIGDRLVFNSNNTSGISTNRFDAKGEIISLKGKKVSNISVATSSFDDVEFYPINNTFIGFTTTPHEYFNRDLVTFTGDYDYKKFGNITVRENKLILSSGVGSTEYTGIVTYFEVYGNLDFPNIRENDIYQIENEQVKVLNVDQESSRIRVIRNQNETLGLSSYSAGSALIERPKKFKLNFGISTSYNFAINRELYFNPEESFVLGQSLDIVYFSKPRISGIGVTSLEIPPRSIYIKNHNLNTGDSLIYSSNGETQISVSTDMSSSFLLQDNSTVYVAKISNDLIGISTVKVGLGTTGSFVPIGLKNSNFGILYFTSKGSGSVHSFKTNYTNTLKGNISKNEVIVSTAETHGLSLFDNVEINVVSNDTNTISIGYNDFNRRLVINPVNISNVELETGTIFIDNHGYKTGQKVIFTTENPLSTELSNNGLYYVVVIDRNKIRLSNSYYQATKIIPETIGFETTPQSGTLSLVNPSLNFIKNESIIFDLSDPSLSFTSNGLKYSAFDLKFYLNDKFTDELNLIQIPKILEIEISGRVGIDSTANVTIKPNEFTPNNLFYKLVPINNELNSQIKKDIFVDNEVLGSNQIFLLESKYNQNYEIVGISSTSFKCNISEVPEKTSYNEGVEYYVNDSSTEIGPINKISLNSKGADYSSLPTVSVASDFGEGSILKAGSFSIGKVSEVEIQDIGFEYPVDYSVRPTAKFPSTLILDTLFSLDYIGITSIGKKYSSTPSLVAIDQSTNNIINDIELFYNFGDTRVTILKNSTSFRNVPPKIIPINNSNGIKIDNIVFNNLTKDVVVTLGSSFSDPEDYPFEIGNKVLIEGVSVGVASTGVGYNSENYNYSLFTLTEIDPNIGGSEGTVTFNLSSYLENEEVPGLFDKNLSIGRIIPESYFPIFNVVLKSNNFYKGEHIKSQSLQPVKGNVLGWDENAQYLKVLSLEDFSIDDTIIGETSGSTAIVKDIFGVECDYNINSSSKLRRGWNTETGFLNNDLQRVHDSDYYQYFSYAIKTQKDFDVWNNPVSALNHPSGFKKFGNLIVESNPDNIGISTDQDNGDFSSTADLTRFIDLNCVYDFDLASENNILLNEKSGSTEIRFNSRIIQDYIESIGNRVLTIDDLSESFNSNPRPTKFSIAESFILDDYRAKKYFIIVQDRKFENKKQFSLVVLLHDKDSLGFINQYGLTTYEDLGFFDFNVTGTIGNLLFYPNKSQFDDYILQVLSFSIREIISGSDVLNLGSSVLIDSTSVTIPQGTSSQTSIVGIASTYRSTKTLIQIESIDSSYYEVNELTIINDGSEVYVSEYGQIATNDNVLSELYSGIGTYIAYFDGSQVKVDIKPHNTTTVDYVVNTFNISLADSLGSSVGSETISGSNLISSSIEIASTPSPTASVLITYPNNLYNGSYFIVSIEDKTNSQYQVSEFLTVSNYEENECYIAEFGVLQTGSFIGIVTAGISGTDTEIYFTPIENIDVDVKIFAIQLGLNDESSFIPLANGEIEYESNEYFGTDNDIKKQFELKHKNTPIFKRYFDASNPNIVDIENNIIKIENNFYSNGEELIYSSPGLGTTQAIGIATTSIPGIGITDKLPENLYVIKLNDIDIKIAGSAEDALNPNPNFLNLTSVGIGNSHTLISKNQNSKVIISIDNNIQSPILLTPVTTNLTEEVNIFDFRIYADSIKSIIAGDLIKINDEIMRVNSVGVGSTNSIEVSREWLGTKRSAHSLPSIINKLVGDYNIVESDIFFTEAPYGKVPFANPSLRADEQDYIGISTSSTFNGRVFIRSGIVGSSDEAYSSNYIFDNISDSFNGIDKDFELIVNGSSVTGIPENGTIVLINNIFQSPKTNQEENNYYLTESVGITTISFTGNGTISGKDINSSDLPRGGVILSVSSLEGLGYQPLVAAGGTAIVSSAGTIQSISIGNSGSGYRSGIQTIVNVGVATSSTGIPNIEFIGTAAVNNGSIVSVAITNPGFGYTSKNPPIVIFDYPLSYSNIPLVYSSESSSGVGTNAYVDIVVGQGSSVISFEFREFGYGYKPGEILTVSIGGTTGIPTDISVNFSEFQISVDKIYSDNFASWSIGAIEVLDSLDSLFDGNRKTFPINIDGNRTTIRSKKGSNIDIESTLLIFINDILQIPGKSYIFPGGSFITFSEAPKKGDKSKLLFYKGTENIDTLNVDILENVKVGDKLTLNDDNIKLTQKDRLVTEIISSDSAGTSLYQSPGVTKDESLLRPVKWCRQTEDLFVDGQQIGKDRIFYESYIQPSTNIIQSIDTLSDAIFVENIKAFFDSEREYVHNGSDELIQNKILIISQDSLVSASATAVVSTSGTVSSIIVNSGGVGYNTSPIISISGPVGFGTTVSQNTATAIASISEGVVTGISVTFGGSGYSHPPSILIESPKLNYEVIDSVSYEGDFGIITGVQTTSIGAATTGIVFDFFIPNNSVLRDSDIVKVGIATTGISGIQTGYYFTISKSNVGSGLTSLDSFGNVVGIGTSFIDNIYQVASVSIGQTDVVGVGITNVAKVVVNVQDYNGLNGIGFSDFYGQYSWGRIATPVRVNPKEFIVEKNIVGISTLPIVQRFNRLKYLNYNT